MHLVVEGVPVLVGEVGAMDVVHEAVAVVIDAVPGNLVGVHPHLLVQVLMRVVDAGVDDCNDDAAADLARPHLPSLGGVDVVGAPGVHGPQLAQIRVVRKALVWTFDLADAEALPERALWAIRQHPTRRLHRHEVAIVGAQGEGLVVPVVHHGEAVAVADLLALQGGDPAEILDGEVLTERRSKRGGVALPPQLELALRQDLVGAGEDSALGRRGDECAMESLNGHRRRLTMQGAATEPGAVLRGAALAHEAPSRARGMRGALAALLKLLRHGAPRRRLGPPRRVHADPSVRHRELRPIVGVELVQQPLLRLGAPEPDDCHAQIPQDLRMHDVLPRAQLLNTRILRFVVARKPDDDPEVKRMVRHAHAEYGA
mmetsp:Transcript_118988/g.344158  ORF Transcript_118988/g.344158 Transcript_118988/m.344158 type:complete len:372 (-) Transcript_118988:128-1243(-)